MTFPLHARARARAGFTLIEMMVALAIFGVVGYSLAVAVDVGNDSQRAVIRVAAQNRSLRAATSGLMDELRETSDATITVTTLADSNHQIRFMQPIDVGGAASWGVYDPTLGPDAASQNRAGWSLRYTVRNVAVGNGQFSRQLVRQILDDTLAVQREKVIVDGLCTGVDVPPGFAMVKVGDVWVVTMSTVADDGDKAGMRVVFHVQTRN